MASCVRGSAPARILHAGSRDDDDEVKERRAVTDTDHDREVRFVPGDQWALLPRRFMRLLAREALLTDPSPAVAATSVATATARRRLLERALDPGRAHTDETVSAPALALSGSLVVAYTRWADMIRRLVVDPDPRTSSERVDRLRRKTADGGVVPAPETLAELFTEMGELMRDGGHGLLSLAELQRLYAIFTTAFARLCSTEVRLPSADDIMGRQMAARPEEDVANRSRKRLQAACDAHCFAFDAAYARALDEIAHCEAIRDHLATERACDRAIAMNPTVARQFLVRAGALVHRGERWGCLEDIQIYLWWSSRQGFSVEDHKTAHWRMAEAYLGELEHRAEREGALLDDSVFHCLLDQADSNLRVAFRYDPTGRLALSSAALHLTQRLEVHRAARPGATELLSAPVVQDASEHPACDAPRDSAPPDYAVPWPIDISAGLPDTALFSRMPTVGSSHGHGALDLLMLDFRGILDLFATMEMLAVRGQAFAQRNPECLHWKYRPKPVHVRAQAECDERLAHVLLCVFIAKQIGTNSSQAFSMEETPHDRVVCALLAAVLFCRTLTPEQRVEVDRLLTLLVFASMDEEYLRRAFPWLELDDGRESVQPMDDMDSGARESTPQTGQQGGGQQRQGKVQSLLPCRLRSVWLGWLSASASERAEDAGKSAKGQQRLDAEAVHRTARHILLGRKAAAVCSSLDMSFQSAGTDSIRSLSQRRLWALLGHLPAVVNDDEETAGGAAGMYPEESHFFADDPMSRMQDGPSPRQRWRPLLVQMAALQPSSWRLNPCMLDPVTWQYSDATLVDPFTVFSWQLRGGGESEDVHWPYEVSAVDAFSLADPPMPPPGSDELLAAEVIWETLMRQLKSFSAVLNSFEAAESARARAMVMKEYDVPNDTVDVEKELQELKRHRHEASLDLELRDYVTLAAVRLKEQDWWGQSGANPAAYKEAMDGGSMATWNPAPSACAPVHLRLSLLSGSPWRAAKVASYRGLAFDVIDARNLLCSGVGALGLSTWFDAFLKPTPFSYIQTRQCEEIFLERLHAPAQVRQAAAAPATPSAPSTPQVSVPPRWPSATAPPKTAAQVAAPGAVWPPPLAEFAPAPSPRRVVVGPDGRARRVGSPPRMAPLAGAGATTGHFAETSRRKSWLSPRIARSKRSIVDDGSGELQFKLLECPGCHASLFGADSRFCRKCGARRPADAMTDMLNARLLPKQRPPRPGQTAALTLLEASVAPSTVTLPPLTPRPPPASTVSLRSLRSARDELCHGPYTSDSNLFRTLARESISSHVSSAEVQYLFGIAVRAEPLQGDVVLDYVGAVGLPVRHDFMPWDSSLAAMEHMKYRWPCSPEMLDSVALGGTRLAPLRPRGTSALKPCSDPLVVFGSYWRQPGDRTLSEALGPRLLRLRRASGLPTQAQVPPSCANAAFCTRRLSERATAAENPSPCRCADCGSAAYCSRECQAMHRPAHAFECQAMQALRAAGTGFDTKGKERNKIVLVSLLEILLARQFSMVPRPAALSDRTELGADLHRSIAGGREPSESQAGRYHVLHRSQRVDIHGRYTEWSVNLEAPMLGPEVAKDDAQAVTKTWFDVRLNHAHVTLGVVRLLSRWVQTAGRTSAMKDIIEDGLIFCVLTGLCQTQHYVQREVPGYSMVSVLAHRMALHIAASREWRTLAAYVSPPRQFQEQGLHIIECAMYGSYYAFLQPKRMPFAKMRPLLPIVCIAWGDEAKEALAALPHEVGGGGRLVSFMDVAAAHMGSVQLLDSVDLDVLTGKIVFALYSSVVEELGGEDAWVLLLDASRGMQLIASPLPARDLRRCAP